MDVDKKDADQEEKQVEKLTDQELDKVSGGTGVGCRPTWSPCQPTSPGPGPCQPNPGPGPQAGRPK